MWIDDKNLEVPEQQNFCWCGSVVVTNCWEDNYLEINLSTVNKKTTSTLASNSKSMVGGRTYAFQN